jgi:DDE superfamily endonuclease
MTRRYGRWTRSERLVCKVPFGHWKTSTFVAALRHDCIAAPLLLDGPMNGQSFKTYVEKILVPTLKRGDIVVMDNVSIHKETMQADIMAVAASGYAAASFCPTSGSSAALAKWNSMTHRPKMTSGLDLNKMPGHKSRASAAG